MLVHLTLYQRSLILSSYLFLLFSLFYSMAVISTSLSSNSLLYSYASAILLLIPSSIFFISVIILFISVCLFFSTSGKVKVLVAQSCLTLCDPIDCSLPGSYVRWITQARILEWADILFSRVCSRSRGWTWVSHICRLIFFIVWATREALSSCKSLLNVSCIFSVCASIIFFENLDHLHYHYSEFLFQ